MTITLTIPPVQMDSNAPVEPTYLTYRDVAKHLSVSIRTVENMARKRMLPHYKFGRNVRFKLADIQARLDDKYRVQEAARRG